MALNKARKTDRNRSKEAFRCEVGHIAPLTLLLALRAFRVMRKAIGMQNRELELLFAIHTLSERNEDKGDEYATCKFEIDTLVKDVMDTMSADHALASLRSAGYILTDTERTRWSYEAMNYKLTVSGRQIIKQYKQQLEALQIELNTAKICR